MLAVICFWSHRSQSSHRGVRSKHPTTAPLFVSGSRRSESPHRGAETNRVPSDLIRIPHSVRCLRTGQSLRTPVRWKPEKETFRKAFAQCTETRILTVLILLIITLITLTIVRPKLQQVKYISPIYTKYYWTDYYDFFLHFPAPYTGHSISNSAQNGYIIIRLHWCYHPPVDHTWYHVIISWLP